MSKNQCLKIWNEHDLDLDGIPVLHLGVIPSAHRTVNRFKTWLFHVNMNSCFNRGIKLIKCRQLFQGQLLRFLTTKLFL